MMDKNVFIDQIKRKITEGENLVSRFESLQKQQQKGYYANTPFDTLQFSVYDTREQANLTNDLICWERYVYDFLKSYFGNSNNSPLHEFKKSNPDQWIDFKKFGIHSITANLVTLRSYIERINLLNPVQVEISHLQEKPYKVFISHSSQDKEFVNELVKLLEFIGVNDKNKLLCSSIEGYQIPTSVDFSDYILKQFYEYNLFVIIIHSDNYYKSAYSMNEMGAAWVLKTDFCSILVKGFDWDKMVGCINNKTIAVKVDTNDANVRLNELKDKLVPIFNKNGVDNSRWESLRDEFLRNVNR